MNRSLNPSLVLVLIGLMVISCSDSESEKQAGKISAKMNGGLLEASGSAVVYDNKIIVGGKVGDKSLSIFISKAALPGTYDLMAPTAGNKPADAEINYSPDGKMLFSTIHTFTSQAAGTVIVTEVDEAEKTISGTFNCWITDANGNFEEITEGTFNNVPYITDPINTLTAVVDGQSYTATSFTASKPITNILLKTAAANNTRSINLYFNHKIQPGTYPLREPGDDPWAAYFVDNIFFVSSSGTATISKHDLALRRIEGSFSFDAVSQNQISSDVPSVTGGAFALTY